MLKAEIIRVYDNTNNVNNVRRGSNNEINYSLLHAYEKRTFLSVAVTINIR